MGLREENARVGSEVACHLFPLACRQTLRVVLSLLTLFSISTISHLLFLSPSTTLTLSFFQHPFFLNSLFFLSSFSSSILLYSFPFQFLLFFFSLISILFSFFFFSVFHKPSLNIFPPANYFQELKTLII